MTRATIIAFLVALFATEPALAQTELSIYGGATLSPDSRVSVDDPGGFGNSDFLATWDNVASPNTNYGVRLTWWQSDKWGWGLDFSHDEIAADGTTLSGTGLNSLGFSDGLNVLTINRYRQWDRPDVAVTPYVGAGIGMSLPLVDYDSGGIVTHGFQLGGPAVALVAGARYPVGEHLSLFGEYKGTYSANTLNLTGGGGFDTKILTNSINFGASFGF